mgnify:CR=1 FL=1
MLESADFQIRIHAESDDTQSVTFRIASGCEKARMFGDALIAQGLVDGYAEIGAGADGVILTTARDSLKGCSAACARPVGGFKAMQVTAALALPADMSSEDQSGVTTMTEKIKVLFLCTGNSCRSQMAEGWARALKGDVVEPYSAGIVAHGLDPLAVQVMAEAGVDISKQHSKTVEAVNDVPFDYVVTVCSRANETCPMWLGRKARLIHVGFEDPPALARFAKNKEEALGIYRRVRDEIRSFVERLPEILEIERTLPANGD